MATATEFVDRIDQIEGVAGCLLIREDGTLLGQTVDDTEVYSALMQLSNNLSVGIMNKIGFSHCCYLSFSRTNKHDFFVFPIDNYLLGVLQQPDCSVATMLELIQQLIGRVSTSQAGAGN